MAVRSIIVSAAIMLFLAPQNGWSVPISFSVVCDSPEKISLPLIYHGGFTDGTDASASKLVTPIDFSEYRSFFGIQEIDCQKIYKDAPVVLQIEGQSYISFLTPQNGTEKPLLNPTIHNALTEGGAFLAGLTLISMAVLALLRKRLIIAVASFLFAVYALLSIAGLLGLKMSMLTGHKLADFALWIGVLCIHYAGVRETKIRAVRALMIVLSCAILVSPTGFWVQIFAYVAFAPAILMILETAIQNKWKNWQIFGLLALMTPDLVFITVYPFGPMVLPFALVVLILLNNPFSSRVSAKI